MIRKDVMTALAMAQQRYMGHLGMLAFQYANICVKHDPSALLPAVVLYNGEEYKIEQVARVSLGEPEENPDDEYKLYVYPLEVDYLIPIIEAVNKIHPEFKIEIMNVKEDQEQPDGKAKVGQNGDVEFGANKEEIVNSLSEKEKSESFESPKYRYICYTMMPVTKKLKDSYEEIVKNLSKIMREKFEVEKKKLEADVAPKLIGYTKEDEDKAKLMINNLNEQYLDSEKKLTDEKLKEIEDGYAYYCKHHSEESAVAAPEDEEAVKDAVNGIGSKLKL